MVPFAKTGGLADVVGALVRQLAQLGHEIRAFMPLYAAVRRAHPGTQPVLGLQNVGVTIDGRAYAFSVRTTHVPGTGITVYFVECPELFDRPAIYTRDPDEHRRFLLFTRAVMESCLRLGFAPDIFHCHDWHTAFLPLFLKSLYAPVPLFAHSRSVLTIHNIGYQGVFPAAFMSDLCLPAPEDQLDAADLQFGVINSLKTGIKFADTVTTVSPTYAREITDTALGMGMQAALGARAEPVIGILNGVDYQEWDPRHDRYIVQQFSSDDLRGKRVNRERLSDTLSLETPPGAPLIGMVTRLASQKGIDILMDALPQALGSRDFGLAVLGSGDERYSAFFTSLAGRFRGRVAFRPGHDEPLAHLIEAGSDMFLMPSQYEPCGLNQMYSLRYGTVPVVRRTGGLADSVQRYNPATGRGTGVVFEPFTAAALTSALDAALDLYAQPSHWNRIVQNGMAQDFSWERQGGHYVTLFEHMLESPT
jgi:starch synthase